MSPFGHHESKGHKLARDYYNVVDLIYKTKQTVNKNVNLSSFDLRIETIIVEWMNV